MVLSCDMHGPMKYRPPLGWWECMGFDGEGARDCGAMLIYDEDLRREGPIPGVTVHR